MPFPLAGRAQAAIKAVANSTIGGCANAYGWTDYTPDMPDDEILKRLLALNLQRSAISATTPDTAPPAMVKNNRP